MNKAPSFQWYPKDCDTDENVRAMDDREFGFYIRCLNHSWLNMGLPADMCELARVLNRPVGYVKKVWERVGKCFQESNGRLINAKQEEQRKNVREFIESRRNAAAMRWDKHKQCTSNARALHLECSPSASPSASAKSNARDSPSAFVKGKSYSESDQFSRDLDDLWKWVADEYPGEVNQYNDPRVFASVVVSFEDISQFRQNLPLWMDSEQWHERRFVPKLENFLYKRQYKTRPKVAPQPQGTVWKLMDEDENGELVEVQR